ncbi:Hydroxyacid oxidase 1 [Holothuria leucospilota]|uniref:(S)-2-hydroxy-acid oxidase n=1 Tax=Holothuria leucospilota TaxID=206669 RepID=A0A9Q1GZX7_HOLLE|nr:Hydroxyacid oxidase 1 [Holothuria leucospilota]
MPTPGISRVTDFEELVRKELPDFLVDYYATGCGDEQTLNDSRRAFQRYRLMPRVLRSDINPSIATKLQGHTVTFPLGVSPTGLQGAVHPDGEKATVKAVEKAGVPLILSSWTLKTIEEVADSAPNAILWMQIYPFKDRRITSNMVKRAEKSGFKAIVVTVDSPVIGLFARSIRAGLDIPEQFGQRKLSFLYFIFCSVANLEGAPDSIAKAKASGDPFLFGFMHRQLVGNHSWKDIAWIKSQTNLPIILKGILTAESAREAMIAGVQGIIVSSHGGRQLDGVQAPIDALCGVVDAVRGSGIEVYMDGGVRSGRDIFKALAIGAKAVFIGRPAIWGLTYNGANGVTQVLDMMKHELSNAMILCGCKSLAEIDRSRVKHESQLMCKL